MTHLSTRPMPPRTDEIPGVIRDRLLTARMEETLGGPNRVYVAHEDYSRDEEARPPWGRGVVMIGRPLWSGQEQGDRRRLIRILFRAECQSPGAGYDPGVMLELAHLEAHARLEGWTPPLRLARVMYPIFRRSAPIPPEWDEDRGLWLSTAEYRLAIGSIER